MNRDSRGRGRKSRYFETLGEFGCVEEQRCGGLGFARMKKLHGGGEKFHFPCQWVSVSLMCLRLGKSRFMRFGVHWSGAPSVAIFGVEPPRARRSQGSAPEVLWLSLTHRDLSSGSSTSPLPNAVKLSSAVVAGASVKITTTNLHQRSYGLPE
jgi:hypothetical protein